MAVHVGMGTKITPIKRCCENCIHWVKWGPFQPARPVEVGDCRRNAPVIGESKSARGKWPSTFATDCCGEYDPRFNYHVEVTNEPPEMLPVSEVTGPPIEEHQPPANSVLVEITKADLTGAKL